MNNSRLGMMRIGLCSLAILALCPAHACQSNRGAEAEGGSDIVAGESVSPDTSVAADLDGQGPPDVPDTLGHLDSATDFPRPTDTSDLSDGMEEHVPGWECPGPTACSLVEWGLHHSIIWLPHVGHGQGSEAFQMAYESLEGIRVLWSRPGIDRQVIAEYTINGQVYPPETLKPINWFPLFGEAGEKQELVYLGTLTCGAEVELGRLPFEFQPGHFWGAYWLVVQQEYPNNHSISTPFPMDCTSHSGDWWFNINDFTRDGVAPSQAVVNLTAMPAQPMAAIEVMLDDLIPTELVAEPLVCHDQSGPPTTYCHVHLVDASVGLGLIAHLLESLDLNQGLWVHPGDPSVSPEVVD